MTLTFFVHGTPAPQGSKRHVGNGVMVESSKKVKPWREAVKYAALEAGVEQFTGPVSVRVTFWMARPKSHYRTGKKAHLLRHDAPEWAAGRPDLDKLLRSTFDALGEAGVWRDDSQVVLVSACKRYIRAGDAGADVMVAEVS